jgi:quercetin dioxygenase-like cupin family protein
MKLLTSILMFASVASLGVANAREKKPMTTAAINSTYSNVNKSEMKILNPGSLPSTQGPSEYFTGKVRITPLCQGEEPSCLQCASVGFEPGARSAWHTHPKGQLLVVTDGAGLIQEWGKPGRRIQKGDVIWTPPGVKHWHGATTTTAMTHIAIQEALDGKVVDWMEKVSEEQYQTGLGAE